MIAYALFCLFVVARLSKGENCSELGVALYDELQCSPIKGKTGDCPSHYTDCEYKRPKDKCLYRKKEYDKGKSILDTEDTGSSAACLCDQRDKTIAPTFTCASRECGENFGGLIKQDCYRKYELDKQCSVGEVCPPFKDSAVCHSDGKEYRKGERYYPKGTCKKCICDPAHEGKSGDQNCQNIFCGFELRHSDDLEKHCAPVYFYGDDKALCCPLDFLCHDGTEKIVKTDKKADTDVTCKYGSLVLQKGDFFIRSFDKYGPAKALTCECILPPLVTCTAKH